MTSNILTEAAAAFNAGDYLNAIRLVKLTDTLDKTDSDAALLIRICALSSVNLGDYNNAINLIVKYCDHNYIDGSELIILSCKIMWERGRWDLTYRLLDLAYSSSCIQDRVILLLLKTLIMLGKNREAVTVFEESCPTSPIIEAVYHNIIHDIKTNWIDENGEYSLENIQSGVWIGYPTLVCSSWPEQLIASRTSGDYLKDVGWILDKILHGSYKRFLHLGNQVGLIELPLIMRNKLEEAAFFGVSEKQEEALNESISLLCSNLKVTFMKTLSILDCRYYGDPDSVIICILDSGLDEIFRYIISDDSINSLIIGIASNVDRLFGNSNYKYYPSTLTNINILSGEKSCVFIKYPSQN